MAYVVVQNFLWFVNFQTSWFFCIPLSQIMVMNLRQREGNKNEIGLKNFKSKEN